MTEDEIQESIKGHDVRNAELLRSIKEKKVATDEIRSIEHHFWSRSQPNASLLAKELYTRGYLLLVICPVDQEDGSKWWNVEAEVRQTIKDAASSDLVSELVTLAARFDALYDGWGTSV